METKLGMKKVQHEKDQQQKRAEAKDIYRVTYHGQKLSSFMNAKELDRSELKAKDDKDNFSADRRQTAGM